MIETAATTFVASLVVFVVSVTLVQIEVIRGRRILLVSFRELIDRQLCNISSAWRSLWHDFSKYIVKLGWYYSVHSLLRFVLQLLVSVYTFFEHKFEHNRRLTKELRKEKRHRTKKTHLTEIADHKTMVSLSSAEQERILKDTLEQDH
jgi:hypothetical protein